MRGFRIHLLSSFLCSFLRISTSLDKITPGQSVRDNETLASSGGRFELGFFSPENSKTRYLGIWYKNLSPQTVVWVANREDPFFGPMGALKITSQGVIILVNSTNHFVWSSNVSRPVRNPVAQILDSGNLIIRNENDNNPDNYLWQSFDYPCDTIIPGMKLGSNLLTGLDRFLSSWKTTEDPSPGNFSLRLNLDGYPQLLLLKGNEKRFRAGSWNGKYFTGGQAKDYANTVAQFIINKNEIYYQDMPGNTSELLRVTLNPYGLPQRFEWNAQTNDWMVMLTVDFDQCENYGYCGAYSSCNMYSSPVCDCLEGFIPKSARNWKTGEKSQGCIRRTQLDCNNDGFKMYKGIKLPDTSSCWFDRNFSLEECKVLCLKNCSCTAYANLDIREGRSGCLLWFDELIDMRTLALHDDQYLFVRVVASELDKFQNKRGFSKKQVMGMVSGSAAFISCMLVVFYLWRRNLRKHENNKYGGNGHKCEDYNEEMGLITYNLKIISDATNNFSSNNKLGQGGFGSVYKGVLKDGQEIAVKRLSKCSGQGMNEFKNEVMLIARLQHRNLVKLFGCCTHEEEKMLIYEYMPNKSLDFFIFDKTRSGILDWHKRIHIINGVSRGLLYLHQDSRLKIIHRDLKTSNILLDKDMNPKISDFGLARSFGVDQVEAKTNRVVGTYGYMSPEYAMNGHFSMKSDVFSFGVLVMEIITGKKNRGFCHQDCNLNLLGHAWILWNKGTPEELIDECLTNSINLTEAIRCIHIALLCVQQKSEDRPNMSSVVLMLGSENSLPKPKQPGFFIEEIPIEGGSISKDNHQSCSANEVTMTIFEAR